MDGYTAPDFGIEIWDDVKCAEAQAPRNPPGEKATKTVTILSRGWFEDMHDEMFAPLVRPTRRSFVAGTAALLATTSGLARAAEVDPAAPRGKDRNLLTKAYSAEKVKAALIPRESYKPFPTIQDRAGWDGLRAETRAGLVKDGEAFLGYHWPEMPATIFLEYARMGNRTDYEQIRGKRNGALKALVFAECVEAKGRFRDDIVNGLWAICEQSFWGVPAHLYIQKADLGLPDPREPIVDLFAAETGALLATAVYLLGDTLDIVNPLVRERVIFEAERRIIVPCLTENFMWMGLPGGKPRHDLPWLEDPQHGEVQPVNNWDAWICWNWLTVALFLDRDADRRAKGVSKMMVCLDKFINTYPDDGGCEEGPGYWNVAAGAMMDGLELLRSATNGVVDIYAHPLMLEMALYMPRTQIAGDFYINQGDASSIIHLDADKMYRFGARLKNKELMALAVSAIPPNYRPVTVPGLFNETTLRGQGAGKAPLYRDTWLRETHIMAARQKEGSTDGLYLACIASDNGKSHSHNDTGSVWVYSNGLPILMDIGGETYQKKSFDKHRYEIESTQSGFHTLPTIGGFDQGVGVGFEATDHAYKATDAYAELGMELKKAYPAGAKIKSWRRTVKLNRGAQQSVEMLDAFYLETPETVILNLMTTCTVTEIAKGVLELRDPVFGKSVVNPKPGTTTPPLRITFDASLLSYAVDPFLSDNHELIENWNGKASRIRLKTLGPVSSGKLRVVVARG